MPGNLLHSHNELTHFQASTFCEGTVQSVSIEQLIEEIKNLLSKPEGAALQLQSTVATAIPWDKTYLEDILQCSIPGELVRLWQVSSSLRIFIDLGEYGQVGLVTYPPNSTLVERNHYFKSLYKEGFRPGDLILGEFFYESDLLVIRCDPDDENYGHVLMALPIDSREDWPTSGTSLASFLRRYIDEGGREFWPR